MHVYMINHKYDKAERLLTSLMNIGKVLDP